MRVVTSAVVLVAMIWCESRLAAAAESVFAAEPPQAPDRPSPGPGLPSLAEITERVRANEKLFANVEMTIREDSERHQFARYGLPKNAPRGANDGRYGEEVASRSRIIFQGDKSYCEKLSIVLWNGATTEVGESVRAYDGQIMRQVGSQEPRRIFTFSERMDAWTPRPNTFLYAGWNCPLPFSAFLAAKKTRRGGTAITWKVEQEETLDGLRCIRLRNELIDGGHVSSFSKIWVAVDRNYLPVRIDAYRPYWSSTLPIGSCRAIELMEVAKGIWIPRQIRQIYYKSEAAKEGKSVASQQVDQTVEKATLNPNYPIEFFREISLDRPSRGVNSLGRPE
jgi:hypothetical protein